ncbi:MAG: hypothetical protein K6F49_07915 [Saccharofermentans sp.]|nr:hypothetical protein [Saccharofermentans sp.]
MKRFTALILSISLLSCFLMTSCEDRNDNRRERAREEEEEEEDDEDDIITTSRNSAPPEPQHDLTNVDVEYEFDDFYADYSGTPWVLENNIPFTHGNVNTYFNQFLIDGYGNSYSEVPTNVINNVATIYRPQVRHYPAQEPGYVIYEISYVEVFPMSTVLPDGVSYSSMWSYHNVGYLDYYTGVKYPLINMSTEIDSFCVSGDVIFNGQTYSVSYYEFREDEETLNETTTDSEGRTIWNNTVCIHTTSYLVVPEGYDGIVMYVYVVDDSGRSFEDVIGENTAEYSEPALFGAPGSDERVEDYVFLSIAELG